MVLLLFCLKNLKGGNLAACFWERIACFLVPNRSNVNTEHGSRRDDSAWLKNHHSCCHSNHSGSRFKLHIFAINMKAELQTVATELRHLLLNSPLILTLFGSTAFEKCCQQIKKETTNNLSAFGFYRAPHSASDMAALAAVRTDEQPVVDYTGTARYNSSITVPLLFLTG